MDHTCVKHLFISHVSIGNLKQILVPFFCLFFSIHQNIHSDNRTKEIILIENLKNCNLKAKPSSINRLQNKLIFSPKSGNYFRTKILLELRQKEPWGHIWRKYQLPVAEHKNQHQMHHLFSLTLIPPVSHENNTVTGQQLWLNWDKSHVITDAYDPLPYCFHHQPAVGLGAAVAMGQYRSGRSKIKPYYHGSGHENSCFNEFVLLQFPCLSK